jgi:hypothetical protein
MSGDSRDRETAWLRAELDRRADQIELQSRRLESVERRLRELLPADESGRRSVTVADAIPALNGGGSAAGGDAVSDLAAAAPAEHSAELDESWWPRESAAPASLAPPAGWRNFSLHDQPVKVVGVSVCGLSRTVVESLVETIAGQQTAMRDFIPVFLTDMMDFEVFRRHGFAWEYFPGPEERSRYRGALGWAEYGRARRELVRRKWGLDEIVAIGGVEFGLVEEDRQQIGAGPSSPPRPEGGA